MPAALCARRAATSAGESRAGHLWHCAWCSMTTALTMPALRCERCATLSADAFQRCAAQMGPGCSRWSQTLITAPTFAKMRAWGQVHVPAQCRKGVSCAHSHTLRLVYAVVVRGPNWPSIVRLAPFMMLQAAWMNLTSEEEDLENKTAVVSSTWMWSAWSALYQPSSVYLRACCGCGVHAVRMRLRC
jgi:hypothetical protein